MTRLMVLGILRVKSMSGYEIQQILQTSQTDRWAGILPGSIYHALKKMDKEELVEVESVETTGHRSKAIYKITEKGESEFNHLLIDSFKQSSAVLPTTFYTGLSMLSMPNTEVDQNELQKALQKQKELLEKQVKELELGMIAKSQYGPIDSLTKITFENMFDQYKLQLKFIDQISEELNKGE